MKVRHSLLNTLPDPIDSNHLFSSPSPVVVIRGSVRMSPSVHNGFGDSFIFFSRYRRLQSFNQIPFLDNPSNKDKSHRYSDEHSAVYYR